MEKFKANRTFEAPERSLSVLKLRGSLDATVAPDFKAALNLLLEEGKREVVLDFTEVEYISSVGWGVILGRLRKFRDRGGDVYLVGMREPIHTVFRLMGLHQILSHFPTLDEVKEELKLRPWTELVVEGEAAQSITLPPQSRSLTEVIKELAKKNPFWGARDIAQELRQGTYGVKPVNALRVYWELVRLKLHTSSRRLFFAYQELRKELDDIKSRF